MNKQKDAEMTELTKFLQCWVDKLEKQNPKIQDSFKDDILERLLYIFDGKVGERFSDERIKEIEREGKDRYDKKTPPGYMDLKEKKDSDNLYGDLIIWKEILHYSKENKKDIIFITNDQKEDWWNIISGKTIGPRVELRKEFYRNTDNMHFHMYKMDSFLALYIDGKGEKIDNTIIEEIDSVSKDQEPVSFQDTSEDILRDFDALDAVRERRLNEQLIVLQRKNEKRMHEIRRLQNQMRHSSMNSEELRMQILNTEKNIEKTNMEIVRIEKDLRTIESLRRGNRRILLSSEELERIVGR